MLTAFDVGVGVLVLISALLATARGLTRMIAQRVAQHDAHLTALVALVQAASPPPEAAIRHQRPLHSETSTSTPGSAWANGTRLLS